MRRVVHGGAALFCAALAGGFFLLLYRSAGAALPSGVPLLRDIFTSSSVADTGSINVVTAILMDYRAFDTLGEATVIFTAVAVAGAILGKPRPTVSDRTMGLLSRRLLSAVLPLFFLFPVYVIAHGHISPGGGFQGGVSLAVLVILIHVAFGDPFGQKMVPARFLGFMENGAALALMGVGMLGIFQGASFLANGAAGFATGTPGTLLSGGIIPVLNLLVGVKVAAGLSSLYIYLSGHESAGYESAGYETGRGR